MHMTHPPRLYRRSLYWGVVCLGAVLPSAAQETLASLANGDVPQTLAALWTGYDPRSEPLDVEVLKAWEEDGVVLQVLRYRIGIFKGQKAMMAAVYGYPKGGTNLPGLVQIHGGGQYADYRAPLTNAQRGYATISIAWAGRINAPGYKVTPAEVRLFWDDKTDNPAYKLTTDWGALDGYHAPSRNPGNVFPKILEPAPWTLDAVKSPRNNGWFLCTLGARRALTFLERQPQVDADRLGVYGHSMGGKLTVLTAGSDPRVKAAAPSSGGVSDRSNEDPVFRATLGDDPYLRRIAIPTVFLSPANDFHSHLSDLQTALTEIRTAEWRVVCSPHHNHQDNPECEVASLLWFDQHLKGTFTWPQTPRTELTLNTPDGVPVLTVRPDASRPVLALDVFTTQQGYADSDHDARVNRFWHHAVATQSDGIWTAPLPVLSTDAPLWAFANVRYALDEPVTGAGYYYRVYTTRQFNLSSRTHRVTAAQLKAAGVKPTLRPSLLIESFAVGWEKEWFTYQPEDWARRTHKVHDPEWAAPVGARLALAVRCEQSNDLVVGLDDAAALTRLQGGNVWQTLVLTRGDFKNATGEAKSDWTGLMELRLGAQETLRAGRRGQQPSRKIGSNWSGPPPEFRNLHWLRPADTAYVPESGSDAETKKSLWAIAPDPALPNVLILGDSISIGYTLLVRRALEGKANVFRPCSPDGSRAENCQGTTLGMQKIDRWLAGRRWDVIHFNWGLHDLKHVKAAGSAQNSNSFDDPRQAEPDAYERQLSQIVEKLKATGAALTFATTTPYPEGVQPARLPADATLYNQIALRIMRANAIRVDDLYTLVNGRLGELQHPRNVHFNQKGNAVLAAQVAESLQQALKEKE